MAQIESVDWDLKRFYLHADTVTNGFSMIEAYREIRLLQQINANNEQNYELFIQLRGGEPKGGGRFTPIFSFILNGWRGVPYNVGDHNLDLLDEIISEEELSDRDVFDRSTLTNKVNIDPVYTQNEFRVISVSPTPEQSRDAIIQGLQATTC